MKKFVSCRWIILAFALLGVTAGCANDGGGAPEEEVSRDRNVSQVPWTKPAGWEGSSVGGVNPGLGQ